MFYALKAQKYDQNSHKTAADMQKLLHTIFNAHSREDIERLIDGKVQEVFSIEDVLKGSKSFSKEMLITNGEGFYEKEINNVFRTDFKKVVGQPLSDFGLSKEEFLDLEISPRI